MTRTWSIQEAKANFSELLRQAEKEPQLITRHGRVVARVVPEQEQKPRKSAWEALRGDFEFSDAAKQESQGVRHWLERADLTLRPAPFSEPDEEEAAS